MPYLFLFSSSLLEWMRAASFGELYLELNAANVDDLYCDNLRMRCELASTCLTYRYIHTYIHKYSDFLVVLISVGLAQARPNNQYTLYARVIVS